MGDLLSDLTRNRTALLKKWASEDDYNGYLSDVIACGRGMFETKPDGKRYWVPMKNVRLVRQKGS